MSLFDEYIVYVQDADGTISEYKEIGFLSAYGRSGLYQRIGLKSWVVRNDWKFRSKKEAIKEVREIAKIIKNDGAYGLPYDPLKELPYDGEIDENE